MLIQNLLSRELATDKGIESTKSVTRDDPAVGNQTNYWFIEFVFCIFLIDGAFGHLVLNVEFLAPVILATAASIAFLKHPNLIQHLVLPLTMFMVMFVIDYLGYIDSMQILVRYIVWLMIIFVYLVLHKTQGFFLRGKIFLLCYLLAHFYFLAPSSADPSRYGLQEEPPMVMTNSSDLAYWCTFAILASIAEIVRRTGIIRIAFVVVTIICSLVLLLTVSRGALVILLTCVLVMLILNARFLGGIGPLFALISMLGIGGGAIYLVQADSLERYQERMENETGSFSGRTYLIDEAIRVFLDSPWIGTGSDMVSPRLHSKVAVPHNQYLGMAVHYGIWPPIILILFLIKLAKISFISIWNNQTIHSYSLSSELVVALLFLVLMSMVSNVMLLSPFSAFYIAKLLVFKPQQIKPV